MVCVALYPLPSNDQEQMLKEIKKAANSASSDGTEFSQFLMNKVVLDFLNLMLKYMLRI